VGQKKGGLAGYHDEELHEVVVDGWGRRWLKDENVLISDWGVDLDARLEREELRDMACCELDPEPMLAIRRLRESGEKWTVQAVKDGMASKERGAGRKGGADQSSASV